MADYPSTPSFGMPWSGQGQSAPQYYEPPPVFHDYDDELRDGGQVLQYHVQQNNAAIYDNENIPDFSHSVASGIPPLPAYDSYTQVPETSAQQVILQSSGPSQSTATHNLIVNPTGVVAANGSVAQSEEGELSEGEFEDIPPKQTGHAMLVEHGIQWGNRAYSDQHRKATRRPLYPGTADDEYSPSQPLTDSYGRSLDLQRQRSASYSPRPARDESENISRPHQPPNPRFQASQLDYRVDYDPVDEFGHTQLRPRSRNRDTTLSMQNNGDTSTGTYEIEGGGSARSLGALRPAVHSYTQNIKGNSSVARSLQDARKDAQGAILNLLPLKVRFQNYIDEGIDPDVVRRQFEAIGLPQSSSEPAGQIVGETSIILDSAQEPTHLALKQLSSQALKSRPADSADVQQFASETGFTPNNSRIEERKDRIARLLAEKTAKITATTSQPRSAHNLPSTEASEAPKTPASAQPSAKANKERMLRLKMEALQKSREQRAQKAATKDNAPILASPANIIAAKVPTAATQASLSLPPRTGQQSPQPSESQPVSDQELGGVKLAAQSIPGLFLSAIKNTPSPLPISDITGTASQIVNHRKRPVASDFDTMPAAASAFKRPFGQNRNEKPLVIDVSDEESDYGGPEDAEADHFHSTEKKPSGTNPNEGLSGASAMRDLPPLSDFPARKLFTTPSSAVSTPPAVASQAKTFASKPEDLLRKEMEIQEMKRKIAEAVQRKKAKQARSGSQTPGRDDAKSSFLNPAASISISTVAATSVQIEQLIDNASRQVNEDQQRLVETHAMEEANVEELKRAQADQRRLRRAKIASDLPAVDAEVEKSRKRLADLKAEMTQLEAAVQKGLNQKQLLAEEMDRLEQEADEQLQAQKNKLDDLRREEQSSSEATPQPAAEIIEPPGQDREFTKLPTSQDPASNDGHDIERDASPEICHVQPSSKSSTVANDTGLSGRDLDMADVDEDTVMDADSDRPANNDSTEKNSPDHQTSPVNNAIPDQGHDTLLQEVAGPADATESDEMDELHGPNLHDLAPEVSDAYHSHKETDGNEASEDKDRGGVDAEGESDNYEPPEATPSPINSSSHSGASQFSPAPPDVLTEIDVHAVDFQDAILSSRAPKNTARDESELPPQEVEGIETRTAQIDPERFFTPYESPLKYFRAYRFHPSFRSKVSGGFKSLTYSNNIEPGLELCRYELAGGACNDPACDFQHFKNIGLADDSILVELGNSAGYSEEEKPRFVAGLRTVLQDLRTRKIKDFQTIAAEIAEYRVRFLGDNSRVLLLDGISL